MPEISLPRFAALSQRFGFDRAVSAVRGFSCVRVQDSSDCGPAALATVARHHGLHLKLNDLRASLGTSWQGTSLVALRDGARQLGFDSSCGRVKPGKLDTLPVPAIAHIAERGRGHFVVIHRVRGERLTLADPAIGVRAMAKEDFLARWTGNVVLLSPGSAFRSAKKNGSGWTGLLAVGKAGGWLLVLCLLLEMAALTMGYTSAVFIRFLIDRILPQHDTALLKLALSGAIAVYAVRMVDVLLRQSLLLRIKVRHEELLGFRYLRHIVSLPMSYLQGKSAGDFHARLSDITYIRNAATSAFIFLVLDTLFLLGSSIMVVRSGPRFAPVLAALCIVIAVIAAVSITKLPLCDRRVKKAFAEFTSRFIDVVNNLRVIKSFVAESQACDALEESYRAAQHAASRRDFLAECINSSISFATAVCSFTIVGIAASLTMEGRMTPGNLLFLYSVVALFVNSVSRLAPSLTAMQEACVGLERLQDVTSEPVEDTGITRAPAATCVGDITFDRVSFGYRAGQEVLSDFSVNIPAGQWVGIVGETGSGKSTVVGLLTGLYGVERGAIYLDGEDLSALKKGPVRERVAVVFQDAGLLAMSVHENIALGRPDLSRQTVADAARQACVHDFIMTLPGGYDHLLPPGGAGISSGQKQRIAIARALVRNSPVLVLDEATSNLDPGTELQVLSRVRRAREGKTTIVITHRLQSLSAVDTIILLAEGRIAETGTHDYLLAAGGRYASLWRAMKSVPERDLPLPQRLVS